MFDGGFQPVAHAADPRLFFLATPGGQLHSSSPPWAAICRRACPIAAAVRRALRLDPRQLAAGGLLAALFSGLPALATGRAFMTGVWWPADAGVPAVGTPLLFDLGVFFTVLGAILTLLLALEEG